MNPKHPPDERFPSTHWSEVGRLAGGAADGGALGALLMRYYPALRQHLTRSRGRSPHDAEDLLQGFMADKVIRDDLLTHADQRRGRFRTFLLTVLDNYLKNQHRHDTTQSRRPEGGWTALDDHADAAGPSAGKACIFDVEWARQLLDETLKRMEQECIEHDQTIVWEVFQQRVLAEAFQDRPLTPFPDMVRALGLSDPTQAYTAVVTGKRMFQRLLRGVVREYARDESEIDEELRDLKTILASARA